MAPPKAPHSWAALVEQQLAEAEQYLSPQPSPAVPSARACDTGMLRHSVPPYWAPTVEQQLNA